MLFGHSILFAIVGILPMSQEASYIDWNSANKLVWDDFKARPEAYSPNAALTSTSIKIDFGYSNESLKFHIRCQFDKTSSWGRIKNDYILSHEQGHFDIAEIYARRLNKALQSYSPEAKTLSKDVNQIYQDIMHSYHDSQLQYDEETKFSIDTKRQEEWLKKIKAELAELKAYANYR